MARSAARARRLAAGGNHAPGPGGACSGSTNGPPTPPPVRERTLVDDAPGLRERTATCTHADLLEMPRPLRRCTRCDRAKHFAIPPSFSNLPTASQPNSSRAVARRICYDLQTVVSRELIRRRTVVRV
jgi:hypothetical protein